jgi:hypothetical protein
VLTHFVQLPSIIDDFFFSWESCLGLAYFPVACTVPVCCLHRVSLSLILGQELEFDFSSIKKTKPVVFIVFVGRLHRHHHRRRRRNRYLFSFQFLKLGLHKDARSAVAQIWRDSGPLGFFAGFR